jgi:hypothetical protein
MVPLEFEHYKSITALLKNEREGGSNNLVLRNCEKGKEKKKLHLFRCPASL